MGQLHSGKCCLASTILLSLQSTPHSLLCFPRGDAGLPTAPERHQPSSNPATQRRVTILPLSQSLSLKDLHCQAGITSGMGPQLPSTIFCTLSPPGAVLPRRHFPAHSPFLEGDVLSWMCTGSPSCGTGDEAVNPKAGWEQLKLPFPPKPFLSNDQLCAQSTLTKLERR